MVGRVLQVALLVSVAILILGMALALAHSGHEPGHVVPIEHELAGLRSGHPTAVLDIGILCLLISPAVGVAAAFGHSVAERDTKLGALALSLLALLALSFAAALV